MSAGEIINIVLCVLSFILAAISVVTVVITLRQNHKMIESSTRPYVTIVGKTTNFQNPSFYLVLKNYGQSGAIIKRLSCDVDLLKYSYVKSSVPFGCISNTFLAPKQSIICNLDAIKMSNDAVKTIKFNVEYESAKKTYSEEFLVNYEAFTKNVQTRASTKDKELKIISYTLQDLVEKFL